LKVKKIGRIWYSTMENIKNFENVRRQGNEERKKQLREKYEEKAGKVRIKITKSPSVTVEPAMSQEKSGAYKLRVVGDTIFDEVQRELEDVLGEIREKEKKLRYRYMSHRGGLKISGKDESYLKKEKRETGELSEKLIMDLGKLLNTANKIHIDAGVSEHGKSSIASSGSTKASLGDVRVVRSAGVPLKRQNNDLMGNYSGNDNFLSVPYNSFPFDDDREREERNHSTQNGILLFIAGLLIFIALVLLAMVILG